MGSAQAVEGKGGLSLGELLGARCHCPSSPEKDSLSSDCEGIACALWFDPREDRPTQWPSLLQGDRRQVPRSCRVRQAHQGPPGLQAPSAALAWRFSNTSLTTCRVSTPHLSGAGCVCMCVHRCVLGVQVHELPNSHLLTPAHAHRLVHGHRAPVEAHIHKHFSMCAHTHTHSPLCACPRLHPCTFHGGEGMISTHMGTRAWSDVSPTGVLLAHSPQDPPGQAQTLRQFLHL